MGRGTFSGIPRDVKPTSIELGLIGNGAGRLGRANSQSDAGISLTPDRLGTRDDFLDALELLSEGVGLRTAAGGGGAAGGAGFTAI